MHNYLKIALFLTAGTLTGVLIDQLILKKLLRVFEKSKRQGEEAVVWSLRYWVILWAILIASDILVGQIKLESSVVKGFRQFFYIVAIISVTIALARLSGKLVDISIAKLKTALPGVSLLTNLARITVYIIGGLVLLHALGISIAPILTGLGIGGVAVALALQSTLTNLVAGIQIIAGGKLKVGDYVKLETGEEGYVEDITWSNTLIRDLSNNMIVVPNSRVTTSIFKNYYLPDAEMSVGVPIVVSVEADLNKVERLCVEVGKEVVQVVPGAVKTFEPIVRFSSLSEWGLVVNVFFRVINPRDQFLLKHVFLKKITMKFQEEGIEFPIRFPQI
jgi:small-conductance mechanosensitive channel